MKIIPVLDLLDGEVVHGKEGERGRYKPINSDLVDSSNPLEVVSAFKEDLGLNKIYIADLNAIEGDGNNLEEIKRIKNRFDAEIMLDFGIVDEKSIKSELTEFSDQLILGTETLSSLKTVSSLLEEKGKEGVIVSIDMANMDVMSSIEGIGDPESAVRKIASFGVKKFIFLDLKKVGSMEGPSSELKKLIERVSDLDLHLITGGGISSAEEIKLLEEWGIDSLLIATALHKRKITGEDIARLQGS